MDGKGGREDWEGGCTAIRVPLHHVSHIVTSNLFPPINQCLLQRKVHIWKLTYYCLAVLWDIPWRPGSNVSKLSDSLLALLSKLASVAEEVLQIPKCSLTTMLRCCLFRLSPTSTVPPSPCRRPDKSGKLSLALSRLGFFCHSYHHNLGQPQTCSKLS